MNEENLKAVKDWREINLALLDGDKETAKVLLKVRADRAYPLRGPDGAGSESMRECRAMALKIGARLITHRMNMNSGRQMAEDAVRRASEWLAAFGDSH